MNDMLMQIKFSDQEERKIRFYQAEKGLTSKKEVIHDLIDHIDVDADVRIKARK